MEEFGRFLKEERLARGISLSAVQVNTRIRTSYLEAIEAGDFASLPGNTYSRAFLKLYAKAIGLDADEVVERFDALQGEAPSEIQEFKPPARERLARRRRKRRLQAIRLASALVILVALVFGGRAWLFPPDPQPTTNDGSLIGAQSGANTESNGLEPGTDGDGSSVVASGGETSGIDPEAELDTSEVGDEPPNSGGTSSTSLPEGEVEADDEDGTAQDQSSEDNRDELAVPVWNPNEEDNEVQVTLTFEGLSWSGVWVDGERVVYQDIPEGTVLSWTGQETIRVRFGRGEAVRIELNGEDLGLAGSGIVDREFTIESVMALRRQED